MVIDQNKLFANDDDADEFLPHPCAIREMINVLHQSRRLLSAKLSCKSLAANVNAKSKTARPPSRPAKLRGAKMPRCWNPTKLEKEMETDSTSATLKHYKLLSYNILAQDLLIEHLHLYMRIDPQLLTWEYRLQNLRAEILALAPDILCLQEMQFDHLENLVHKIKGNRQLQYVFKKKTGHRTDGCAIIYDKQKFSLLAEQAVEYYTPGEPLLNRDNVALFAKFHPTENPTKVFVVATTHLLYNPRRDDVRTAQIQVLLKNLVTFSATQEGEALPILLTGDFNCVPFSPPYYALLSTTEAPPSPTHHQTTENQTDLKHYEYPFGSVSGKMNAQALQMIPINFGLSTASTYQDRWITVDYILQSIGSNRRTVKIWSVYKLPSVSQCQSVGQIPNKYLGSDHYSLAITFSV